MEQGCGMGKVGSDEADGRWVEAVRMSEAIVQCSAFSQSLALIRTAKPCPLPLPPSRPTGLMAASTAASPLVQSQILGHILAPIASQWSDPAWRRGIASPMEFAAKYLPVQQGAEGYLLGAR